jgi:hypothetical protein
MRMKVLAKRKRKKKRRETVKKEEETGKKKKKRKRKKKKRKRKKNRRGMKKRRYFGLQVALQISRGMPSPRAVSTHWSALQLYPIKHLSVE